MDNPVIRSFFSLRRQRPLFASFSFVFFSFIISEVRTEPEFDLHRRGRFDFDEWKMAVLLRPL